MEGTDCNSVQVADRSFSRLMNQKAIIEKIYQSEEGISRAQLAKELGISKPTVASNVENLIEKKLVEERGEGEADKKGGRKPVMLYFNKECRYVGAIDLAYRQPVCAIADLKHNIIALKKVSVPVDADAKYRREFIKGIFLQILEDNTIALDLLEAIVISQPGVINDEREKYYSMKKHHVWTEIDLKNYIIKELNTHVSIYNDVNLAAIGLLKFDSEPEIKNLIYVSCGIGIGAGIIINGKLYSGENHAAGEIGSTIMNDGQTLDDYIAMEGLIKKAENSMQINGRNQELSFGDIVKMVKEKNIIITEIVYKHGREMGKILYNYCLALDISHIIFGGEFLELGDTFFKGMEEVFTANEFFKPKITKSGLKEVAGIFGCFEVGINKIIERLVMR